MDCVDLTCLCRQPQRFGRNTEQFCRLAEVQIWLDPVRIWPIDWDFVI